MEFMELDDITKQNRMSCQFALEYLVYGMNKFADTAFQNFQNSLQQTLIHLAKLECKSSCSKLPKNGQSWCSVCDGWKTAILNSHKYGDAILKKGPDWSNIDSSKWPKDAKEVEKCYHPNWSIKMTDSSQNSDDISVLIGKLINCNNIRLLFENTVDPVKIRLIRNKIVHSPDEITLTKKKEYCKQMLDFLETDVVWAYEEAKDVHNKITLLMDNDYIDLLKKKFITEHELNKLKGGPLSMITRDKWCARLPKKTECMETPVMNVFVHHTAGVHGEDTQKCSQIVRSIQNLHMDNYKWDDIAYNFLIGEDGCVYEGRGWNRVGAHTLGWNRNSVAFAFLGNYNDKRPNSLALKALRDAISSGIKNGHISPYYTLYGHRDKRPTESPGNYLYAEIRNYSHYHLKP